jgi:hypothetical protein
MEGALVMPLVIAGLDPAIHLGKMTSARVIPDQVGNRRPRMTTGEKSLRQTWAMNEVTKIKWLGDHRLHATFNDGAMGEHDFPALLVESGPMIEPLHDPAHFGRVFLEDGAPTWPNTSTCVPIGYVTKSKLPGP